ADDREPAEVGARRAAFVGAVPEARPVGVAGGLRAREQPDSRVALLHRAMPARRVVLRRVERRVDVVDHRAELLEAEDVGLPLREPRGEPASLRGTDPVEVERAEGGHAVTIPNQVRFLALRATSRRPARPGSKCEKTYLVRYCHRMR